MRLFVSEDTIKELEERAYRRGYNTRDDEMFSEYQRKRSAGGVECLMHQCRRVKDHTGPHGIELQPGLVLAPFD